MLLNKELLTIYLLGLERYSVTNPETIQCWVDKYGLAGREGRKNYARDAKQDKKQEFLVLLSRSSRTLCVLPVRQSVFYRYLSNHFFRLSFYHRMRPVPQMLRNLFYALLFKG